MPLTSGMQSAGLEKFCAAVDTLWLVKAVQEDTRVGSAAEAEGSLLGRRVCGTL